MFKHYISKRSLAVNAKLYGPAYQLNCAHRTSRQLLLGKVTRHSYITDSRPTDDLTPVLHSKYLV